MQWRDSRSGRKACQFNKKDKACAQMRVEDLLQWQQVLDHISPD